ncbi:MAG TPA: heavy metal translocating P-type ATPase metal-binding domain-containing protein [Alphaproteobacteria bacterium]|nr:heavy metal translocating P-type ATPase metal-binding domain-containing protein [Alphaproteobacteria bacterium]
MNGCAHCGRLLVAPVGGAAAASFCCPGCKSAHGLIQRLGLERYYRQRCLEADGVGPRPETSLTLPDLASFVRTGSDGAARINLLVDRIQCGACVWLIEAALARLPGVVSARLAMTTRRLAVVFRPQEVTADVIAGRVSALGYPVAPFDPEALNSAAERRGGELLTCLAVAGFAAANIMLLSVAVWAGHADMSQALRDLLHWVSALIALPTVVYAGRPFFRSAITALKAGRTNMDVPISLAVILTTVMSLVETLRHAEHAYFDSAVTLLFFLLVGRYLEHRARGKARNVAERLLALGRTAVTVVKEDGRFVTLPASRLRPGMVLSVATGARIGGDGIVREGEGELDVSLITGEAAPKRVEAGARVFAGTINLGAHLRVIVTATGEDTLLADIVRMMEAAEQGRARYVALADRIARAYAPLVHLLALSTFLYWFVAAGIGAGGALMIAVAVLIITCPCALALSVPTVQILASGRLMRRGVLLKSADGLERLAAVDTVVLDKTGTLTLGRLELAAPVEERALAIAASIAATSTHPLARALARACPQARPVKAARETAGCGVEWEGPAGLVRLGRAEWCGVERGGSKPHPELWLKEPGRSPVQFCFRDRLRPDAAEAVSALRNAGYDLRLVSGDHTPAVAAMAQAAGIEMWAGEIGPDGKARMLQSLKAEGRHVLMVGDGLNDAPALAAASVSISPASAAEISQIAADAVFQGDRLMPVVETLATARRAQRLVKQNLALSLAYNLLAVPLAAAGLLTPLIAALAMSSSSILVIGNALRLDARPGTGETP